MKTEAPDDSELWHLSKFEAINEVYKLRQALKEAREILNDGIKVMNACKCGGYDIGLEKEYDMKNKYGLPNRHFEWLTKWKDLEEWKEIEK